MVNIYIYKEKYLKNNKINQILKAKIKLQSYKLINIKHTENKRKINLKF